MLKQMTHTELASLRAEPLPDRTAATNSSASAVNPLDASCIEPTPIPGLVHYRTLLCEIMTISASVQ